MSLEEFSKKRFLIVDELDSFRFSTKKTLKSLGLKLVDTAASAQTVLNGFQNVNYDVVLCNYELGKGKNGQELLEELRYRKLLKFSGLFFIISAEVEKGKVMGTIENEPDGYLVKPIPPQELESRLSKALMLKDAMRTIDNAIDEGDFISAIDFCDKKIAEKDRYLSRVLKTKGWLLVKTGELDQAKDVYESVLRSNDFIWAEYGLARIAIKKQEFERAEKLLNHIIEKDPHQVEAMDLLAEIYRLKRKPDLAQAFIDQAIKLSPNALSRQKELADLCVENNKPEEAINAFRNVLKLGEQSVYASPEQYFDFASFLAQSAKDDENPNDNPMLKEAFDLLNKSKKRFSNSDQIETQAKLMSANLNAIVGNTEEAQQIFNSVMSCEGVSIEMDAKSSQIAAKAASSLGNKYAAEELLERAADLAGNDGELISDIYDDLNKDVTLEDREQAAQMNKQGIKLYKENKVGQAAEELRKAIPLTPRHISLNLNLAQVLLKLYKQKPVADVLKEVERYLHKVRHVPKHHKEYKRYQYLLKQLKGQN
jgi:tetratricopeptide (TPR) repeat protein